MLNGKSVIRELSEYATARGKEIGYKYSKEKSCVWQQSFEYSVKGERRHKSKRRGKDCPKENGSNKNIEQENNWKRQNRTCRFL